MPVLAVADVGNGRSIALGIDGGWRFDFSDLGIRTGGRAHGALWDGLLGWLMRDPRFEPAQIDVGRCIAKHGGTITVHATSADRADLQLDVTRTDVAEHDGDVHLTHKNADLGSPTLFTMPPLPAGGYSALLRVGGGATTRRDFACETGGDEWADSRPDNERLRALADETGGSFHWADEAGAITMPKETVVSTERHVAPVAPPWMWALFAAAAVGAHWYARRRSGLS